ncbi:hypothetical protein V6259_17220 [Marinomonas sp. TI.3.20]|uniref:hypothetical protein n=1 Tax=Marinomonas sp. TI.3.20 TaxID=3121296 RepID=UPI00311EA8FB
MKYVPLRFVAPVLALSCTFSVSAAEKFPSPFGLEWGMSNAQLQAVGFSVPKKLDQFRVLTSVSTPKPWSQGDTYIALTYRDKLVKAIVNSKSITGDAYGSEGKALYTKVKTLLTKKYGTPESHFERTGMKLYEDADEFYQCLGYSGCGFYYSSYSVSGGNIQVTLKGSGRGRGYVVITYESPAFYNAKKAIDLKNSQSDSSAL